jgi:glycosyltransferase 2 family protein
MQKSTLKKIGKRTLQIGLPIVVLVSLLWKLRSWGDWNGLLAHAHEWNPWLLVLAFFGFCLQELSFGLIWQSVLARLGFRLNLRASLRIYLASEFVRYIPGNVWHVLTRILWVGKYGASRTIAFASMTIELITKLAAGAFIFAISLIFWGDVGAIGSLFHGSIFIVVGVVSFLALLIIIHPRILNGLLNLALRILKREPIVLTVSYMDILLVTLKWCVSWIVAGCAFFVLLQAIWPGTTLAMLPLCIGIYAIAWDFGFVTFITPSGLGFRELAITVLFALSLPSVPVVLVAILALLSRAVSTLAELLCVSVAYVSGGGPARTIQQDTKLSVPEDQVNKQHDENISEETAAGVSAEGGNVGD